jgi:uncharacterized protein
MRILAFSDLHRDLAQGRRLVERAAEVDLVIGAGDFASVHEGLEETIDVLAEIETPSVIVPGNNETDIELHEACRRWRSAIVLHGDGVERDGVPFFGLGAGIPETPWEWSFDLDEEDAEAMLADCPEGAVLVLHSPPKGHLDEADGSSLGSEAILQAIERTRPRLAVCGHIHAWQGHEARIGDTPLFNLGPAGRMLEV